MPGTLKYFSSPQFFKVSTVVGSLMAWNFVVSCSCYFQMTMMWMIHCTCKNIKMFINNHIMTKRKHKMTFSNNTEGKKRFLTRIGFIFCNFLSLQCLFILWTEHLQHIYLYMHIFPMDDASISCIQSTYDPSIPARHSAFVLTARKKKGCVVCVLIPQNV